MKAVVAAFNQEKALVGASVITNLRMELFEALLVVAVCDHSLGRTILCWPVLSRDLHLECSLQRVLVNVVDDVGAGGGAVGPQPVPQRLAVQVGGDGQTWGIY